MANRWKGNFVVAAATTSSGTAYTGKANGAWGLNSQLQQKQAGLWATSIGPPYAPTIGTASSGDASAVVNFTAPSNNGGSPITGYTATSSPGGFTGTGTSSPITVSGLTNGTSYTFTVTATNINGTGLPSAASNSVVPNGIVQSIIMGMSATPYLASYQWKAGFQTKNSAPTTTPAGLVYDLVYIQGDAGISGAVAASSFASPFLDIYTYTSLAGFGTRYSNPSTLPDFGYGITYNATNGAIAISTAASPFVYAYPFTIASGIGTKYANPATLPAVPAGGKGIGFKPDGTAIAMITSTTPYITAYNWSSGFGSKVTNPSALAGTGPNCMSWNSTGTLIAVGSGASNNAVQTIAWSSGFGAITSGSGTNPTVRSVNFNSTNQYIVGTGASTYNYINTYPVSLSSFTNTNNGIDTKDSAFSTFNSVESVAFALASSPFISAYQFTSGAISTKYANPSTLPEADGYSVVFAA
jgi:stage V sporulation protein SpoVS